MRASKAIERLQELICEYGDLDLAVDDGLDLRPIEEVDLGEEGDEAFVIWPGRCCRG